MTYFERYKNGQCVAVWNELTALGETVRDSAIVGDAVSVAHLTMERVATNIDRLVERLASHGYEFGVYPDGGHAFPSSRRRLRSQMLNSGRSSLNWSIWPERFRCRCGRFGTLSDLYR